MPRLLKRVIGFGWLTLAVGVVLAALVVTAARLIFPQIAGYRLEVERRVSEALNTQVRISELGARWSGFHPQLQLGSVLVVNDAGEEVVRFANALLSIDLLRSVARQQLILGRAELGGAHVTVRGRSPESFSLEGNQVHGDAVAGNEVLGWLASQTELTIRDSQLLWLPDPETPPVPVHVDLLRVANDGERHQLDLELHLESGQRSIQAAVDFTGSFDAPHTWNGEAYLNARALDWTQWRPFLPVGPLPVEPANADLELWLTVRDGKPVAAHGPVRLRELRGADGKLLLDAASGELQLDLAGGGPTLGMAELFLVRGEQALSIPYLGGGRSLRDGQVHWQVRARGLNLGALRSRFAKLPGLPAGAAAWWQEAGATGIIEALDAELPELAPSPAMLQAARIEARFKDLSVTAWRGLPGLRQVSGSLLLAGGDGRLRLDSQQAGFDYRPLFRQPLVLDRLAGEVAWHSSAQGVEFNLESVQLASPYLTGSLAGMVRAPTDGPLFLDLAAEFRDGDVTHARDYYPVGIMSPGLVDWLDKAFVAGRVPRGSMVLRGPADRFPFAGGEGRFQVLFSVTDGVLHYFDGWPEVTGLGGEVEFANNGLLVRAKSGSLGEIRFADAEAAIAEFGSASVVTVSGASTGELASGLKFLVDSPLNGILGGVPALFSGAGPADFRLGLQLPLDHRPPQVDGQVEFQGASLRYDAMDLTVNELKGRLRFTEAGIAAERLTGRFLDGTVQASAQFRDTPHGGARGAVLKASGQRLDAQAFAERMPLPVGPHVRGKTDWAAELAYDVGPEATTAVLTATTDLKGVAINLPDPSGKPASRRWPTRLALELTGGDERKLTLKSGPFDFDLRLKPGRDGLAFQRGAAGMGIPAPPIPARPGMVVAGDAARVSVSEWQQAFAGGSGRFDPLRFFRRLDVRLQELEAFGFEDREIILKVERDEQRWHGFVSGDRVRGEVAWPLSVAGGATAQFKLLSLVIPDNENPQKPTGLPPSPDQFPNLRISIRDFQFKGRPLGALEAQFVRSRDGMVTEYARTKAPHLSLEVTGNWSARGGSHRTSMAIKATSDSLGDMLNDWGYRDTLRRGETQATINLEWPDAPARLYWPELTGQVNFTIEDGNLLEVDPGAGRLLGLLSVYTLPQRLFLDFSDIFSKGFAFDTAEGEFALREGNAYSSNTFMEGPSARIEFNGRVGILSEDYDQQVRVVPRITGALPLVGTLAGGTPLGAVMLFFQQLFGRQVDEGSEIRYKVTGPWSQPEVVQLTKPSAPIPREIVN